MDIQAKITAFASLGATWVMWLLIGLSVGGLAIVIERALYLLLRRDNIRKLKNEVLALLQVGAHGAARERLQPLLGTVIGIVRSFEELNNAAGRVTAGL